VKEMEKIIKYLAIAGVIMILIGVVLELISHSCYKKEPKEFFESRICRYVDNN
jgi:hypothetical protein